MSWRSRSRPPAAREVRPRPSAFPLQFAHRNSPSGKEFIHAMEAAVHVPSSRPWPLPWPMLAWFEPAPYSESATFTPLFWANETIQSRSMVTPLWASCHVEVLPPLLYWLRGSAPARIPPTASFSPQESRATSRRWQRGTPGASRLPTSRWPRSSPSSSRPPWSPPRAPLRLASPRTSLDHTQRPWTCDRPIARSHRHGPASRAAVCARIRHRCRTAAKLREFLVRLRSRVRDPRRYDR
jgi:hypothetical protein